MSTCPGSTLEDYLMWMWGVVVATEGEEKDVNWGVRLSEMVGNIPPRPRYTEEEFKGLVNIYESDRQEIERLLDNYDEDTSWRDYCQCFEFDEADNKAEEYMKKLKTEKEFIMNKNTPATSVKVSVESNDNVSTGDISKIIVTALTLSGYKGVQLNTKIQSDGRMDFVEEDQLVKPSEMVIVDETNRNSIIGLNFRQFFDETNVFYDTRIGKLEQIAQLVATIHFAGDFKAETHNEAILDELLNQVGAKKKSWEEITTANTTYQLDSIEYTWPTAISTMLQLQKKRGE